MSLRALFVYLEPGTYGSGHMEHCRSLLRRMEGKFETAELIAEDGLSEEPKRSDAFGQLLGYGPGEQLWITNCGELTDRLSRRGVAVAGYETDDDMRLSCSYVFQDLSGVTFRELERIYRRCHRLPWEILETPRCVVREFCMEDMDALFALYAAPHVTDFVEPLYERKKEEAYEADYIRYFYGYYDYGMWLVIDKESGNVIGRAGIEHRENCGQQEAELGYIIAPAYQGRGIAEEVCRGILDYAGKELGLCRILSRVHPDNAPSVALMKKLGFSAVENAAEEEEICYALRLKT